MSNFVGYCGFIFAHIVLPALHLSTDVYLIYEIWSYKEFYYVAAMSCVYAVPGVLEILYWVWTFYEAQCSGKDLIKWIMFGITFPISHFIWNLIHVFRGRDDFKKYKDQAKALNSISTMTKSPLQTLIQTVLIILHWKHEDKITHLFQVLSILWHVISHVYHMTEHLFYEISKKGGDENFSYRLALRTSFSNLIHFSIRILALSILLMYGRGFCLIPLGLFLVLNFLAAKRTLKTSNTKNIFTSLAGIFLPTAAFVSRADFISKEDSLEKFKRFSRYNSFIFVIIVSAANFLNFTVLALEGEGFDCDHLPPLSYMGECNRTSLVSDLFDQELEGFKGHAGYLYTTAGPLNILLVVHIMIVWVESFN